MKKSHTFTVQLLIILCFINYLSKSDLIILLYKNLNSSERNAKVEIVTSYRSGKMNSNNIALFIYYRRTTRTLQRWHTIHNSVSIRLLCYSSTCKLNMYSTVSFCQIFTIIISYQEERVINMKLAALLTILIL